MISVSYTHLDVYKRQLLRSANTFLFGTPDEPSRVENTDVDGVLDPLRTAGLESARTAVLVGAGATARSALAAFAALGVERVVVVARDAGRAQASLGLSLIHI